MKRDLELSPEEERRWRAPGRLLTPVNQDSDVFRDWVETANRLKMLKESGRPVNLGTLEEMGDPSICECGRAFYLIDDYMCSKCREALDA